jgi:hypothetical protein
MEEHDPYGPLLSQALPLSSRLWGQAPRLHNGMQDDQRVLMHRRVDDGFTPSRPLRSPGTPLHAVPLS